MCEEKNSYSEEKKRVVSLYMQWKEEGKKRRIRLLCRSLSTIERDDWIQRIFTKETGGKVMENSVHGNCLVFGKRNGKMRVSSIG